MVKESIASPTPELIIVEVASSFHLPPSELKSRKRDETTALARQVAMYIMRQETNCSLADIGRELGGRSPATVSYAYQKIVKTLCNNSSMKARIVKIQGKILKEPEDETPQLLKKRLTPEQLINELEKRGFQRIALVIMPIDDWKAITEAYHSPLIERIINDLLQIFPERVVGTNKLSFIAFAREFRQ